MKHNTLDAPHIRHHENTRTLMTDAALALLFIYGMAFFYYGPRVAMLGGVSVLTAVVADTICNRIARRPVNFRDLSPIVTGMLLPLLMPASISYYLVIVAAAFAVVVAKHPFGGTGYNVFNPAAAGFSFIALCFPERLFAYPVPLTWLPVFGAIEPAMGDSAAFTLSVGGMPGYNFTEMLLGNHPGPMGATNILVIVACLLYLVLRNTIHWESTLCFFATVALWAFLFPRTGAEFQLTFPLRIRMMAYELMSGMLLLGGGFMLGDPVTTPKRRSAKIAFSFASGIVVMLFRRFSSLEGSLPFAVLLMNAGVWGFDMIAERIASFRRHKKTGFAK